MCQYASFEIYNTVGRWKVTGRYNKGNVNKQKSTWYSSEDLYLTTEYKDII